MANTFVLQGVVTASANDTYTQVAVNTGLTGLDKSAFRIKDLIIEHPAFQNALGNQKSEFQITRGSKAAMVNYADSSLLIRDVRQMLLNTAGSFYADNVKELIPQGDIIIVETVIYVAMKTTLSGAIGTLQYKLLLEEINISADQRVQILSSRLP